jgi:putative peptidoglycan lipid II flippase
MLVNLGATGANLLFDVIFYLTLPTHAKVIGLAVGYSLSYGIGTVVFTLMLRRRIRATRRTHVIRTYVRLTVAGVLAALAGEVVLRLIGEGSDSTPLHAFGTVCAITLVVTAVFVLLARRMRVTELGQLVELLPGRSRATA